jgi:hypothetical protein
LADFKKLGEGIIGLTSRIALIENYDFTFSAAGIGSIISAVLITVGQTS